METVELDAGEAAVNEVWIAVRGEGGAAERGAHLRSGKGLIVGAGPEVDLRVEEPTVSCRHLRLDHEGSRIVATDLGSRNGTMLLGHRVERAVVGAGTRLALGRAELEIHLPRAAAGPVEGEGLPGVVGRAPSMLRLADRVRRLAPLGEPVLIRGESGTGKELVAKALHDESGRRGPFVPLNAASLSRELAESELFGHVKGAFTGAGAARRGAFREAHEGTLFIDETAQLGLDVQAKLLRAVEDGLVRPLGADAYQAVGARLVAATSEPLEDYVVSGRFRADLFERIAVCVVRVPSLRERPSDIPELAVYLAGRLGIDAGRLTPSALRSLGSRTYRGNVRELRNVILHASIAAVRGGPIDASHIQIAWEERSGHRAPDTGEITRTVRAVAGNLSEAARRLGIPRSTLRDRLRSM